VDFPAHQNAPAKECDGQRPKGRFGCRPRLSLAPESFAPSAAPDLIRDSFQTVLARAVLGA